MLTNDLKFRIYISIFYDMVRGIIDANFFDIDGYGLIFAFDMVAVVFALSNSIVNDAAVTVVPG